MKKYSTILILMVAMACLTGCKSASITGSQNIKSESPHDSGNPNSKNDDKSGSKNPNSENDDGSGSKNPNSENDDGSGSKNPNSENDDGSGSKNPNSINDDGCEEGENASERICEHKFDTIQEDLPEEKRTLDILIMIDNKVGQKETAIQHKTGNSYKALVSSLNGVDWRMGFLSIGSYGVPQGCQEDGHCGKLYNLEDANGEITPKTQILTASTTNREDLFKQTLYRNRYPADSIECRKGLYLLKNVEHAIGYLTNPNDGVNDNVLRQSSKGLAVIIITDKSAGPTSYYADNVIANAQKDHEKLIVYGIMAGQARNCMPSNPNDTAYYQFKQLVEKTGGLTGNICGDQDHYNETFEKISQHLKKELVDVEVSSQIPLQHSNIIEDSIKVKFKPRKNKKDYDFNSGTNQLTFKVAPVAGTKMTVSYKYVKNIE